MELMTPILTKLQAPAFFIYILNIGNLLIRMDIPKTCRQTVVIFFRVVAQDATHNFSMKISVTLPTRPLDLLLPNGRRRFLVRPAMTQQQVVFMKATQTFPHLTISAQHRRPALKVTVPVQPVKNLN